MGSLPLVADSLLRRSTTGDRGTLPPLGQFQHESLADYLRYGAAASSAEIESAAVGLVGVCASEAFQNEPHPGRTKPPPPPTHPPAFHPLPPSPRHHHHLYIHAPTLVRLRLQRNPPSTATGRLLVFTVFNATNLGLETNETIFGCRFSHSDEQ